jgi:hypothetical protein
MNTPSCEDCGARSESVVAFADGGAGSSRSSGANTITTMQPVGRADVMLGHPGYLCKRCWWARARAAA